LPGLGKKEACFCFSLVSVFPDRVSLFILAALELTL